MYHDVCGGKLIFGNPTNTAVHFKDILHYTSPFKGLPYF